MIQQPLYRSNLADTRGMEIKHTPREEHPFLTYTYVQWLISPFPPRQSQPIGKTTVWSTRLMMRMPVEAAHTKPKLDSQVNSTVKPRMAWRDRDQKSGWCSGWSSLSFTCCRSHESSDFLLRESLNAQEYDNGVRPRTLVMFGSPPARLSILSSSTLPNLAPRCRNEWRER